MNLERILFFGLFCCLCLIAYRGITWWQLRQAVHQIADPLLEGISLERPTIIYFSSPQCYACKSQQAPTLERLQHKMDIQVIAVDATEQPESATNWGVMTVPTTFVLNEAGLPVAVNNGIVDEVTLAKQLGEV